MDTKEIKITVPEGYEIDKENSTFECIKFKKKGLTYDEICKNLTDAGKGFYYASSGAILLDDRPHYNSFWAIGSPSYKQVRQLVAVNKLMNVAKYLNKKPLDWDNPYRNKWYIYYNHDSHTLCYGTNQSYMAATVYFDALEHAQQAVEILGGDVVKCALGVFD